MKPSRTRTIVLTGVMAGLVFIASHLSIPLAAGTRIHLGNIMCLLAGILLGPVTGGLSAGIGSMFYDLTSSYVSSAPFTLVFKFLMAMVCGLIAWSGGNKGENSVRNAIAGTAGILTYIFLYLTKGFISEYYVQGYELQAVLLNTRIRGVASLINGIIAVVLSIPAAKVMRKAMKFANKE